MAQTWIPRPAGGLLLFAGLLVLSGACSLFFFDYASRHPQIRFTLDSGEFLWAARNLRNNDSLYAGDPRNPVVPSLYTRRTPFYPAVIALLWSFWADVRSVIFLQMFLSLLNGYLLWSLLSFSGVRNPIRLVTVAAFLFYPANVIYTQLIMAGILLQSVLLASLFCLARFLTSGSSRYLWSLNVGLSLALLTKPILMFFWLPNLAFHAWLAVKRHKKSLLVPALLPLLVTVGWSYRNFQLTGLFRFSSIRQEMMEHLTRRYPPETGKMSNDLDRNQALRGKGVMAEQPFLHIARKNFFDLARRQLKGMVAFFLDPGRFDFYQFSPELGTGEGFTLRPGEWRTNWRIALRAGPLIKYLVAITLFNLLIAVAFLLYPFQAQRMEWKVFVMLLVLYVAISSSAFGRSRYRLPVVPELFLAAAVVVGCTRASSREDSGEQAGGPQRAGLKRPRPSEPERQ